MGFYVQIVDAAIIVQHILSGRRVFLFIEEFLLQIDHLLLDVGLILQRNGNRTTGKNILLEIHGIAAAMTSASICVGQWVVLVHFTLGHFNVR